jgi:hypothetical protein
MDGFSKNTQISNFMTIREVGTEFFHMRGRTDGQRDTTKLIAAFFNFVVAPKEGKLSDIALTFHTFKMISSL